MKDNVKANAKEGVEDLMARVFALLGLVVVLAASGGRMLAEGAAERLSRRPICPVVWCPPNP